jgi:hypothetical protein
VEEGREVRRSLSRWRRVRGLDGQAMLLDVGVVRGLGLGGMGVARRAVEGRDVR